jgi:hypothetical protein
VGSAAQGPFGLLVSADFLSLLLHRVALAALVLMVQMVLMVQLVLVHFEVVAV